MFNFKLVDGDIVLDGQNDIALITGDDEIVQTIRENLSTNKGEWILNTDVGFDRFSILGQKYNQDNAIDLLRETIFQDDRIDTIENLDLDFERKSRTLTVKFEIIKKTGETVAGEVSI